MGSEWQGGVRRSWQRVARHGRVRTGPTVKDGSGVSNSGLAVKARRGEPVLGEVRHGQAVEVRFVEVTCGSTGHGMAVKVSPGCAGPGLERRSRIGEARCCVALLGAERLGEAVQMWRVMARTVVDQ